ncbi:hypothetical protein PR048_014361 [Dryococelus australis]|uniref:Exonuclease domain-containing protein n=1 Tax=Dryococelus australis TaxID=614101 RepID=A0ABQ9HE75_9NEOP|nr:hypothetical protein PR048_014361 [Dryococelus australis]
MTGLDVQTCHILEVACIVTGPNLNTIAESPPLIIHQPDDVLSSMNEWCIENHKKVMSWHSLDVCQVCQLLYKSTFAWGRHGGETKKFGGHQACH